MSGSVGWEVNVDMSKKLDEVLSDPQKVEKLEKLLENADKLEDFLGRMDKLLSKLELFSEAGMLDDLYGVLFTLMALQRGFVKEETIRAVAELMGSASFLGAPDCLEKIAQAIEKEDRVTLTGMLGRLRDPDVQRGLAIVFNSLKAIGNCAEQCKD